MLLNSHTTLRITGLDRLSSPKLQPPYCGRNDYTQPEVMRTGSCVRSSETADEVRINQPSVNSRRVCFYIFVGPVVSNATSFPRHLRKIGFATYVIRNDDEQPAIRTIAMGC